MGLKHDDNRKLRYNEKSKQAVEAGPKSRVLVKIIMNDDDPKRIRTYVEISIFSNAKPDVARIGEVEMPLPQSELLLRIGAVAGAIAEELNEAYKDNLETSEVVSLALEGFRECVMKIRGDGQKTYSEPTRE
jgi:hypothetical protein